MNINSVNRGSEWRKWDLHVHTPMSIVQHYGGDHADVWDKYITLLESLPKEIKVLGINDYYFIDGFEKVASFKRKGRLKNIDTILPVLEFRIDTFSGATENKFSKINLHIVFDVDPENIEYDVARIKSEFIGNIHLSSTHKTEKLTRENLCEYSTGKSLQSGFSELIPETSEVIDCIHSAQWKEKTILVLGYNEWNNLEKGNSLRRQKKYLYKVTDAFFTASENDDIHKKEQVLGFFTKTAPAKPLLHSQDTHNLESLTNENYRCFTWIKADPTFNGLRQIICEPTGRVSVQSERPEPRADYSVIDAVRFKDEREEPSFSNKWIYLNQNLNSIIGGKSSGKSILLYHIAKTISPERILEIHDDSTYTQLKYSFEEADEFDFEVKWRDGATQKLKSRSRRSRSITYLPQLYLNRLAEEQKHELNSLVEAMLCEESKEYDRFVHERKEQVDRFRTDIVKDIRVFCSNRNKLREKEKELIELGDAKAIEKNIERIQSLLDGLRKDSKLTMTQQETLEKLVIRKQAMETEISNTEQLIEILEFARSEAGNFAISVDDTLQEILQRIDEKFIGITDVNADTVESLLTTIADEAKKTVATQIKTGFSVVGTYKTGTAKPKQTLKQIATRIASYDQKITSKASFETNRALKDAELRKLHAIRSKKSEIEKIKKRISSKGFESKYRRLLAEYRAIVRENVKYKKVKGSEDLKLESRIKFDSVSFHENFSEKIKKRRSLRNLFGDIFKDDGTFVFDENEHVSSISNILKSIVNGKIMFNAGFHEEQVLTALFGSYYSIDYDLIHKGDRLLDMSPGKVGIVLFQLFLHLSKSTNPILIDQPEDSLDNRTVYRELNEFIKAKKTQRQMIVVSHNANLVVSTDSENVLVANQAGQNRSAENRTYKFEYVNGALEQSFVEENQEGILYQKGVREHVCEILEGGDEAFKKREMKYRL